MRAECKVLAVMMFIAAHGWPVVIELSRSIRASGG